MKQNFFHLTPKAALFALLLLSLLPCFTKAQNNNTQQRKDSLRHAVASTQGEDKLKAYMHLAAAYFFESNDKLKMDTMLTIYADMDKEAERQKNVKMRGLIRCNIIKSLMNGGNAEEVFQRAPEYLKFLQKEKAWLHYYALYADLIIVYVNTYQFDRALSEAQEMYRQAQADNQEDGMVQALYAMSNIYFRQDRGADGIDLSYQVIDLIKDKPTYYFISSKVYFNLCQSLLSLKQYDRLLPELQAFENVNNLYEAFAKQSIPTTRANLYGCYARYYLDINDLDKAEYYYNKMDSTQQTASYKIMLHRGRANIYRKRKQFDKALAEIDQLISLNQQASSDASTLILKASILSEMGNCTESILLANQAILMKDSISKIEYARQSDGLRTQYEVDRHIAEKEKKQVQVVWAVISCLLLLIALLIYALYSRRLKQRNLALYQQVQELNRKEKAVESCFLSKPEETLTKEMLLFRQLNECMKAEKLFVNTDINRKTVADHLGTNENYLATAIRAVRGETFSDYISSLRLQHALELLNDRPDMNFEAIAADSGYGSYSQFFRTFSKKYGLSPSEYRKLSVSN